MQTDGARRAEGSARRAFFVARAEIQGSLLISVSLYSSLSCLLALILQFSVYRRVRLASENALIRTLRANDKKMYEITKDTIDAINIKCHDLKHRIYAMQKFPGEETEELKNLLRIYDSSIRTGNDVVDVVLMDYALRYDRAGVRFSFHGDGSELSFLSEVEIASLFGNACASPFYGASGSGGINTTDAISWFEAFEGIYHGAEDPMADLQGEAYFQVNEKLKDNYTEWMKYKDYAPSSSTTSVKIGDVPWDAIAASEGGADIANYGDAAIMIIKRTGGEGYDLPATSSDKAGEYSHDKTSASSNDGTHGEAYVSRICNVYTGATDLNEYNYATDAPDYTGGTHTYADFAPDENGEGDYGNLGQAMREAAHGILWTTVRTAAMSGMSSNTDIVRITPPWKIGIIAADIALGVLLAGSVAWMVVDQAIAFKKKQSV